MKTSITAIYAILAFTPLPLRAELPGYLAEAFRNTRWVAYSPTGNSPMPTDEEMIKVDLQTLHAAGFRGIVTYGCDGLKSEIPKLARGAGIEFVILGIYNPLNEGEWRKARGLAGQVDGYCVGNEGIGREQRYTLETLRTRIEELRAWSGRPVSTSEQIEDYFTIPGLLTLGDWLFPNIHPFWNNQASEPGASKWTKERVDALRQKADGRVIICKEVGLPTDSLDEGAKLPDEQSQAEYYQALRVLDVPFVYFEAFDQVWKRDQAVEPFWGLFNADRKPKRIITWLNLPQPPPPPAEKVLITSVQDNGKIKVTKQPEGGFFEVKGTATGVDDFDLMFFVHTGDPAATGWFLQIKPNGVFDRDKRLGTWSALGQIGNKEYPPKAGQKIGLKILAVPKDEATKLAETRQDIKSSNKPFYSQDLPDVPEERRSEATGLEVEIEKGGR